MHLSEEILNISSLSLFSNIGGSVSGRAAEPFMHKKPHAVSNFTACGFVSSEFDPAWQISDLSEWPRPE